MSYSVWSLDYYLLTMPFDKDLVSILLEMFMPGTLVATFLWKSPCQSSPSAQLAPDLLPRYTDAVASTALRRTPAKSALHTSQSPPQAEPPGDTQPSHRAECAGRPPEPPPTAECTHTTQAIVRTTPCTKSSLSPEFTLGKLCWRGNESTPHTRYENALS